MPTPVFSVSVYNLEDSKAKSSFPIAESYCKYLDIKDTPYNSEAQKGFTNYEIVY